MHRISETQFRSLCDGVYRDREQIYEFNPSATHAEVLLWTVLGSLFSLLSLADDEIPVVADPTVAGYSNAIVKIVEGHRSGEFDPREILRELVSRAEASA